MHIDICLCTFRRPVVANAIASLRAQTLPEAAKIRLIIADNDIEDSARATVEAAAKDAPFPVIYIHAPAQNISIARNACLEAATAPWIAFLDDDEIAPPEWITALYAAALAQEADVIFGPAIARYPDGTPEWITSKDYNSNYPEVRGSRVETGHTCNVLMRRDHPAILGERFLEEQGRSGGEDTEFFFRVGRRGAKLAMTLDAPVFEDAVPDRLRFGSIMKRKYRSGVTYGRFADPSLTRASKVQRFTLSSAKAAYSALRSLFALPNASERNYWIFRAGFHYGVLMSLFEAEQPEIYGEVT